MRTGQARQGKLFDDLALYLWVCLSRLCECLTKEPLVATFSPHSVLRAVGTNHTDPSGVVQDLPASVNMICVLVISRTRMRSPVRERVLVSLSLSVMPGQRDHAQLCHVSIVNPLVMK